MWEGEKSQRMDCVGPQEKDQILHDISGPFDTHFKLSGGSGGPKMDTCRQMSYLKEFQY